MSRYVKHTNDSTSRCSRCIHVWCEFWGWISAARISNYKRRLQGQISLAALMVKPNPGGDSAADEANQSDFFTSHGSGEGLGFNEVQWISMDFNLVRRFISYSPAPIHPWHAVSVCSAAQRCRTWDQKVTVIAFWHVSVQSFKRRRRKFCSPFPSHCQMLDTPWQSEASWGLSKDCLALLWYFSAVSWKNMKKSPLITINHH